MMKRVPLLSLVCAIAAIAAEVRAVDELKAAFLLNFARFVEWPQRVEGAASGEFRFCFVGKGRDAVRRSLETLLKGQTIKGRAPKAIAPDSLEALGTECEVLYINQGSAAAISDTLARLNNAPVLTVGDSNLFIESGGMIQFRLVGDRLRFRIRPSAAERAGLKISSRLLSLAEVVP